jgi:ankyrin repeat protein
MSGPADHGGAQRDGAVGVDAFELAARLVSAAGHGDLEALRAALADGADPSGQSVGGVCALVMAISNGRAACVEELAGLTDPDVRDAMSNRTPLMWAASLGEVECVRLLAKRGNLDARAAPDGGTALMWAASGDRPDQIVAALLEAGADPVIANARGATPRQIAGILGRAECSRLLLAAEERQAVARAAGTPSPGAKPRIRGL